MTAFLKEKEITDLDVLEGVFECVKDAGAGAKRKLFTEQRMLEAFENIRGMLYNYETQGKDRLISKNEYEALRDMFLSGNGEFLKMMESVFCRAEMNRSLNLYDMQSGFLKIYHRLYENALEKYSYFSLYFDKISLEVLERKNILSVDKLYEAVMDISTEMFELISRFQLEAQSGLVREVAEYAWKNVENNISLEKIAEVLFVNKTYLSHLFKQETGRTFVSFFTEIRMLRSRVLLKQHCKVYECALQLGYEDAEYFSKVFKNYYGCKPTEYRMSQNSRAFHHNNRAAYQR